MKEKYIELMEKALSAYTDEHIQRYFNDVKTNGLTEHGFPRLTANIGILMAHGRRKDLMPIFMEIMEVCCDMFLRCNTFLWIHLEGKIGALKKVHGVVFHTPFLLFFEFVT